MWNRYKILLLPLLVYLLGGVSLIIGDSPSVKDHSMEKGFPFPPDQGTKTEWNIPSQPAKMSRSFVPVLFTSEFTEVKTPVFILPRIIDQVHYNYFPNSKLKGRSPPSFSC